MIVAAKPRRDPVVRVRFRRIFAVGARCDYRPKLPHSRPCRGPHTYADAGCFADLASGPLAVENAAVEYEDKKPEAG
jgi:hypothetical protein